MTLDISQIVRHYRHRWQIETAFRDVKQNFGFDKYHVKSRKSINRFVQLSFVAASLTKLMFTGHLQTERVRVEDVCQQLGIHWYRPVRLTLGFGNYTQRTFTFSDPLPFAPPEVVSIADPHLAAVRSQIGMKIKK